MKPPENVDLSDTDSDITSVSDTIYKDEVDDAQPK